jgi:hypothetical protein
MNLGILGRSASSSSTIVYIFFHFINLLSLLGKCSATSATPPVLFLQFVLWIGSHIFALVALNLDLLTSAS